MIKLGKRFICIKTLRDGVQTSCTDGTEGYPKVWKGEIVTITKVDNPIGEYGIDIKRGNRIDTVEVRKEHLGNFFVPYKTHKPSIFKRFFKR